MNRLDVSILVAWVAVALVIGGLGFLLKMERDLTPTDDSDLSAAKRSGMRIRIDYLTGCQYLESTKGSFTPRLDKTGFPLCSKDKP